ncbi:MAG: alpha-amylase [Candidatus Kapabacteria bacterium]|nr:alpha-amylase [Candidatus Kapabacteria bacterium]
MTPLLRKLIDILEEQEQASWHEYSVPGLWVGDHTTVTFPSGASYILHQLRRIDALRRSRDVEDVWELHKASAYNAMVRHVTSYNHGVGTEQDGWRSTGTFIKLLGLLPYVRGLGIDTLVLLPITEIGVIGRKGELGSPYAIKHPFRLDQRLAEPCIDMSVEDQARVLIETCHLLGMKVVLETVLRTASIDSDLVSSHPEWFYWVDESGIGSIDTFRPPTFSDAELKTIRSMVDKGIYIDLPVPSEPYQALFDHMPLRVEKDERGWKGIGARGRVLRIPGAFADWPPDDQQPAWSDVTYLRLHDHPSFRYMAYNTIRMFERDLDQPTYRQASLWNTISGIIPHYIRMFDIDGAMIDMGHALPEDLRARIVAESRSSKSNFILFEENFHLEEASLKTGYDAVIGYLPFDAFDPTKLASFVKRIANGSIPIRYFGTPESHNTPRVATRLPARAGSALWLFLRFLPKGFCFLHAGLELDEQQPVNTGLGFTDEEIAVSSPEKLALFSDVPLSWTLGRTTSEWLREKIMKFAVLHVVRDLHDDDHLYLVETDDHEVVAFVRVLRDGRRGLLVVVNITDTARTIRLPVNGIPGFVFASRIDGVTVRQGEIMIDLAGADVVVVPTLHRATSV